MPGQVLHTTYAARYAPQRVRSSRAACQVSRITYCVLRTSNDQRPTTNNQQRTTTNNEQQPTTNNNQQRTTTNNDQRTARRIAYRPSAARGSRAFRL
ncbi:hypothetical protein Y026_3625 [Burkholderia pseudomallei TSV28]|nr:hypothetical protein Y026_3625 [Burkholderia pseudomallei TSV28]